MDKRLLISKVLMLFALIVTFNSFAQLPSFTVTATSTPQTCLGNGSLTFAVAGTNPAATIDYSVYLMPGNTFVGTVTTPFMGSLLAGTYQVVATQSLAGESNTSTVTVTIANQLNPLAYTLALTKVHCGTDGVITVNVTSGNAVTYEIISGPVTRPPQASNVFNNLPVGQYQVRVNDNCGTSVNLTVQLTAATPLIVIKPGIISGGELSDCNIVGVSVDYYTTGINEIFFPLTFQYTVFPPGGGAPIVVTQVVTASNPTATINEPNQTGAALPLYYNQVYNYNIKVTDACGNVYTQNASTLNPAMNVNALQNTENCADYSFEFDLTTYKPPFTINFTSVPAGFVPANFNTLHPTFNAPAQTVYGEPGNYVPEGVYTGTVTDACSRTAPFTFTIAPPELQPQVDAQVLGCNAVAGNIEITIPGRLIASITMTAAPAAYPDPLPDNVDEFITSEGFFMPGLPLGNYTFSITDSCGDVYVQEVELEPTSSSFTLSVLQRPGCVVGEGSIRLRKNPGTLIAATITAAPPAFAAQFTLPHDVTSNIATNGMFYMNSLPEGIYTFTVMDECGGMAVQDVQVDGYTVTVNTMDTTEYCGSFDLAFQHASDGNNIQAFWLQEYNEVTGKWGHPGTGVVYTEGNLPSNGNSILLTVNTTTLTLPYTGHFRILKTFYVYSNGSSGNQLCTHVLHEFDFNPEIDIIGASGFPCDAGNVVVIDALGIGLTYTIVDNDDHDIVLVNNGTNNIFPGLATGTYTFMVSDLCTNRETILVDVNELAELEITETNLCEGLNGQLSVTQYSFLNYEWWEESDPTTILSTSSVLNLSPFDSALHAGIYHVTITSNIPTPCIDEDGIELIQEVIANQLGNAGEDNSVTYCNDGAPVDLTAYLSTPHDEGGTWTDTDNSGALSNNTLTTEGLAAGTYHFTYTATGMCDTFDEAIITIEVKNIPLAPVAAAVTPVCEGEDVQLSIDAVTDAVYTWTGPDNFTSDEQNPLIAQAGLTANGTYQVSVTVNGCTSPATPVAVTIKPIPVFTIEGNTSLCIGQDGALSIVAGNFDELAVTYQWYYDNVLQPDVTAADIEIYETGSYRVVVDNNGCISEQTAVVIENTNAFEVELEAGCKDFDYVITVTNAADLLDVSYDWSGPGGFNAVGPEVVITDGPAGDYTVTVTSADGCSVIETVNVPNTHCSIPKGISPGDADFNNEFDLSNLEVQHLKIFNRYGLEVYEKANYVNEWHGQSKSGELPTGTYYYEVTLSKGKRVTGWVYLQRAVN